MSHRYLLTALIVLGMLLVPLAIAPKAQAVPVLCPAPATICWNNSLGGSWETVANWILLGGTLANRLPTASDDVVLPVIVDGISAYTVTISSVQTVNSIVVSPTVTLNCASTCTLTIKSHTPVIPVTIIGGGLIGVAGFTPAVALPRADIYGVLNIDGNVVNDASLVDVSVNSIHIDAGGTFVNVNSLSFAHLLNDGVFVEKCPAVVVGGIASVPGTVVTESPCPTQVSTASGSQVSGTASFSSDLGGFTSLTATAVSSVSPAPPAGLTFPAGLFSFTISGLQAGGTVTVTITLPAPLPAGSFSYWKFHGVLWQQMPAGKVSLDSTRTIITLQLTDGATPDDSDSVAGQITDPGGPAITPSTTTVNCSPSSVAVGSGSICTATVTGSSPTGTVSFTQGTPGTGTVTFSPSSSCTLSSGSCSVTATGSSVGSGSVTVTGSYGGDSNNQASSGTFSLQVITPAIVPEYPIGLPLLAIFMIIAYGLIKRRTRDPQNI